MNELNGDRSAWLRCYRCWSQNLEIQIHYDAIRRVDPETGDPGRGHRRGAGIGRPVPRLHARPAPSDLPGRPGRPDRGPLGADGRRHPLGRLLHGHRRPGPGRDLLRAPRRPSSSPTAPSATPATREFFTHVRFHKHDEERIVVHLLVELYARSAEEATEVLEDAARGAARDHLAGRGVPPAGARLRRGALAQLPDQVAVGGEGRLRRVVVSQQAVVVLEVRRRRCRGRAGRTSGSR